MIRKPALLLPVLWLSLSAAAGAGERQGAAAGGHGLVIGEGSLASRQVVALGRDLRVDGEAAADVAAINGSVAVTGRVRGDVIVLGGDARLGSRAWVGGDVFVLGGTLEAEPGARIGGRSVAYPTFGSAWVILLGGPSLGRPVVSPVVIGAKLALMAAWLAWTLLLFATGGRGLLSASEAIRQEPFRNFFVGLSGVLALFLSALALSALAAVLVGVPLLLLVVLVAALLKLWGMVALFHALGAWLAGRLSQRRWLPLNAAVLGLCVLGAIKILPWVGAWVWTAASFIAVGAALTTKFGRREPWFETVPLSLEARTSAR